MSGTLESHYGSDGIVDRIVDALDQSGTDTSSLTPDSFAGADEFHIGGRKGSELVADLLNIEEGRRIIDLGCGIGGPARFLARTKGVHVTGIDLTPEFVEAASALTELVGMSDKVDFHVGSATSIPFDDDSFDAATMIHVGMNIADKAVMMSEMARVTRAGGTVLIYDVMRVGSGALTYPMPWSSTPEFSFLDTQETYVQAASKAGLGLVSVHDHSEMAKSFFNNPPSNPAPVNLVHLMGMGMPTMFTNAKEAINAGIMSPIILTFEV